jgi:hypothetical protein
LVINCQSILARWRNYFFQVLNVHGVNDVRQAEIHTSELLVPEPSAFEVQLAVEKLSRLTPYAEEIIGDHQCGFRRKRSTTDHIFCFRQILEKKLE